MINIPAISRYEWHPFTISSTELDEQLTFHINCTGDWTSKAKTLLMDHPETPIRLEGPIGAPSQGSRDFEVVVLIGAGIGVTVSSVTAQWIRFGWMFQVS